MGKCSLGIGVKTMAKILLYQWCSDSSEAILRLLPQAMPDYVIDVTDFGYFRLNRRRLASASGECEQKLYDMLAHQNALLDQYESVVCYGTPFFFHLWAETAGGARLCPSLKEQSKALLLRFDAVYLPELTEGDTVAGKLRTMELGVPIVRDLLQGSRTDLRSISDFIQHLGRLGYAI